MYVIGFDVGGTRLKSGAVMRDGTLKEEQVQRSGFSIGAENLLQLMVEEVERISKVWGQKPAAVGLAFSGAVHPEEGVVLLPGKIKGLEGFPIVSRLQQHCEVPVVADNDGRVSIYAEAWYGLAREVDWAVTVTIGTGVGSGVMLDGRILRDPYLQFGTQLGHLVMDASHDHLCITNARGTSEMFASATALAMSVRNALQRGLESSLSDAYFEDPRSIDFQRVIEAVEEGDALCRDELRLWTRKLGWTLVNAVHAYAPEKIILSGGAVNAARHFIDPVREHVNAHIFRYPAGEPVSIEVSQITNHAGVLGTAARAWEHIGESR